MFNAIIPELLTPSSSSSGKSQYTVGEAEGNYHNYTPHQHHHRTMMYPLSAALISSYRVLHLNSSVKLPTFADENSVIDLINNGDESDRYWTRGDSKII